MKYLNLSAVLTIQAASARLQANRNLSLNKNEELDYKDEMDRRILAVVQESWPECVDNRLTAEECKDYIDGRIAETYTDIDRFVRTIIQGRRNGKEQWYNAIVIPMDDSDLSVGRDNDGLIYYDFVWSGSGEQATIEQETEIPPIIGEEVAAAGTTDNTATTTAPPDAGTSAPGETGTVGTTPTADPMQIESTVDYDVEGGDIPIIPYDEQVIMDGASTDEAIQAAIEGGETAPIAGGVLTDPGATNTAEGDAVLQDALAQEYLITQAGDRTLGPFDCTGLTGNSCCLLIKAQVRDHDTNGKAIQCFLDYVEGTQRKNFLNSRGKKIFIDKNHEGYVSKEPTVVGDWPSGVDFPSWILAAGGLTDGQRSFLDTQPYLDW